MSDRDSHQVHVRNLVDQDSKINDVQMKEFRMQLQQSLEALENKSKKVRRRILISLAVYLAGMIITQSLAFLWREAAPNATAGIIRGLVYWPFVISALVAAVVGVWMLARHIFQYAPQLARTRFDLQTSILLELQQKVNHLHESIDQRDE